jgi:hypothetical protein
MLACEIATAVWAWCFSFAPLRFEPDEKHVEDDAELRDGLQRGQHLPMWIAVGGRKQGVHRFRRDGSDNGRAQKYAGDNLADDRRLAEVMEAAAEEKAEPDDRGERRQNMRQHVHLSRLRRRHGDRSGDGFRRDERFPDLANPEEDRDRGNEHQDVGDCRRHPEANGRAQRTRSGTVHFSSA